MDAPAAQLKRGLNVSPIANGLIERCCEADRCLISDRMRHSDNTFNFLRNSMSLLFGITSVEYYAPEVVFEYREQLAQRIGGNSSAVSILIFQDDLARSTSMPAEM